MRSPSRSAGRSRPSPPAIVSGTSWWFLCSPRHVPLFSQLQAMADTSKQTHPPRALTCRAAVCFEAARPLEVSDQAHGLGPCCCVAGLRFQFSVSVTKRSYCGKC